MRIIIILNPNNKNMKDLYKKALQSYIEMLEIHIDTKTTDLLFHRETAEFYEKLFSVAHSIGERYIDLDGKLMDTSLIEKKKRANEIISNLRKDIEEYQKNNDLTLGTDDLLGGLADDLEDIEGTSKGFIR